MRAVPTDGPVLSGARDSRVPVEDDPSVGDPESPQVSLGLHGGLLIPSGSAWGSVARALSRSAEFRRKREKLEGRPGMLVPLPGVPGYLHIECEIPDWQAGLVLRLEQDASGALTHIRARGSTWGTAAGCESQLDWRSAGWSLPRWREALDRLTELKASGTRHAVIEASYDVPAEGVVAFVRAARDAGIQDIHVAPEMGYHQPSLAWLAAHQMRNGGWNEEYPGGPCNDPALGSVQTDEGDSLEPALSGLALCAFLSAGYTNRGKHAFARILSRGLRFLKNRQAPSGQFTCHAGEGTSRDHAWATLAMLLVYDMTGSPIFKGSAQRALDHLDANWRAAGDDPLVTVLTAMALAEARSTNDDARKRGRAAPLSIDDRLGTALHGEARSLSGAKDSLSRAAGLLSRVLLGEKPEEEPKILIGSRRLATSVASAGAAADPCLLWLASLLAYRAGPEHGFTTLRQMHVKFIRTSARTDGPSCCFYGSWDPRPNPTVDGGRVAATALLALLEPLFFRAHRPRFR